jgi:hypothetical protein
MSSPAPTRRERPLTRRLLPWLVTFWAVCWTLNAFRGLRFPHPFAKGLWLYHYGYGFVKRGLPGTAVAPWVRGKTAAEVDTFLDAIGLGLYIASVCITLAWARRVLGREDPTSAWWGVVAGVTVFVLSPYVVSAANLCGYFDHLLVIGSVAAVALVGQRRFACAGLVAAACALTHEMFFLFGLPLVCFALWLRRTERADASRPRAELRAWVLCLAPSIAVGLLIFVAEADDAFLLPGARLYADAARLGVVHETWLSTAFSPLFVSASESAEHQAREVVARRLTGDPALEVIHPTTIALLFLASWVLWARRRGLGRALVSEAVALVAVVLAPLGIVAIAGDWARFMTSSHFHGVAALLVILSAPAHGRPVRLPLGIWAVTLAAGAWAIHASVASEIPLTSPLAGVDRAFVLYRPDPYACGRRLFPNSDFSEGTLDHWQAEGRAFQGQPLTEDASAARGSPAHPVGSWVGSYEASPIRAPGAADSSAAPKPEGDVHTGTLRSRPFRIDGDRIVFRVSGGWDSRRVFVRLLVDGKEVERETGLNQERLVTRAWDVGRYRGRDGVIEIVDGASGDWGHINAEGFCYER